MGPPIGNGVITKIRSMQFGPCLREKCAMWREFEEDIPGTGTRELFPGGVGETGAAYGPYFKTIYKKRTISYCGLAGKP